jgi:hypothetical protein
MRQCATVITQRQQQHVPRVSHSAVRSGKALAENAKHFSGSRNTYECKTTLQLQSHLMIHMQPCNATMCCSHTWQRMSSVALRSRAAAGLNALHVTPISLLHIPSSNRTSYHNNVCPALPTWHQSCHFAGQRVSSRQILQPRVMQTPVYQPAEDSSRPQLQRHRPLSVLRATTGLAGCCERQPQSTRGRRPKP